MSKGSSCASIEGCKYPECTTEIPEGDNKRMHFCKKHCQNGSPGSPGSSNFNVDCQYKHQENDFIKIAPWVSLGICVVLIVVLLFVCPTENTLEDIWKKGAECQVLLCCLGGFLLATIVLSVVLCVSDEGFHDNDLSSKLKEKGWRCFHSKGCGWCAKQLEALGSDLEGLAFEVSTDEGKNKMKEHNVNAGGYPHWKNIKTGEEKSGFQDKAALEKMVN